MKGFVYIIQSIKSGLFYIGSSENPIKRLEQHNSGLVIATKNKGPWELKLFQEYNTVAMARKIEYKLKRMKSRKIIERIVFEGKITLKISGYSAAG